MIHFHTVDTKPGGLTTVGYWRFTKPDNGGDLIVEVARMNDWRFMLSVYGHELIEALYCWMFHVTTEVCDDWDNYYERLYESGKVSPEVEPGHDPKCPYHWGHMGGVVWEYIAIYGTFASWKKYIDETNRVMEIGS